MSFALLGYGRFGRAFAGLLQQAGHAVRVHDPRADVPATLASPSPAAALDGAAWVVLAMPVPLMGRALQELQPRLDPAQTVIDVGSVKQQPCVVLCASPWHPDAAARTRALFDALGCTVIMQDPAAHDRAMAETHALAFFIARALVEMGVGEDLSMAPPSFLGLANMLAAVRGDAGHLFAAIQRENPYADAARARLLEHLELIHRRLRAGDTAMQIPPPMVGPTGVGDA